MIGVTAGLLPLLRVQPVIGRRFTEEDDSPDAPWTIMLSYGYWQSQFGADPALIGTTLRLSGVRAEIIGVLPHQFRLSQDAVIYYPFKWSRAALPTTFGTYEAIARLLPGTTIEQAHADVERMIPMGLETTRAAIEESAIPLRANLHPLKEDFVGTIGNGLWVLLRTVGILLLIACANVANPFLVRSEGRQREVAIRTAMGAGRGQIARQFLLESLVLGLLGGLAGLGLAFAGVRLLKWMGPETLPRLNEISLDPTVLAFTLGISLLSGFLFGMFPVLRVGGLDLVASLKEGSRGGGVGKQRHRARNTLVVAQMALALVLLAGSGLMIRTFQAMQRDDPGFANPADVLTFRIAIPPGEIEADAEVALAYEDMWRRFREIPGVTAVGAGSSLTMGGMFSNQVSVEDFPIVPGQMNPFRQQKWITEGYFEAMQNPVLAGRPIRWADIHDRAPVLVVTEDLAGDRMTQQLAHPRRHVAGLLGPLDLEEKFRT